MADCRLADLNVRFKDTYGRLARKVAAFSADFDQPDVCVTITQEDIATERLMDNGEHASYTDEQFEPFAAFRCLGNQLPAFDGVVMHGCLIRAGEKGILFTARSGTGKTTHMMLWKKLLGEKMSIVNGDKPLVRFLDPSDEVANGYGTPWAGKENLRTNTSVGLTDVCMIERATVNETVPLSFEEGVELLMRQTYLPADRVMQEKTSQLIDRIAKGVRFWKIRCNMDLAAAQAAFDAIFSGQSVADLPLVENTQMPQICKTEKVLCGTFMPTADTDEFILTDLPFEPTKVSIFCSRALLSAKRQNVAYIISVEYDALAKRIPVMGKVFVETALSFGFSGHSKMMSHFEKGSNSFCIKGFQMNGMTCRFAAGKTYTFFVSGE